MWELFLWTVTEFELNLQHHFDHLQQEFSDTHVYESHMTSWHMQSHMTAEAAQTEMLKSFIDH